MKHLLTFSQLKNEGRFLACLLQGPRQAILAFFLDKKGQNWPSAKSLIRKRPIRALLILAAILFYFVPLGLAQETDKISLFYRANLAYKDGDYKEAVEDYEEILSNGFESGPLYYNLGNSYFKDGELGKAVLNYERARRIMPRDSDLRSNYAYARSLVKPGVELAPQPLLIRLLKEYSLEVTANELAVFLLIIYIVGWVVFIVNEIFKWPRKRALIILTVLCVIFLTQTASLFARFDYYRDRAIVLEDSDSKFEPLEDATTHFSLSEGTEVKILKSEAGWLKIKRLDGKAGWVKKDAVEKI